MTDCSPHILSWWKTNELLKEFIDRGYLDIALFDVYNPSDLLCVYSGQTLSANTLHIPPFLILNSVLSCLKQDVLAVRPTGFAPAVISLLSTQYEYFPSDPLILRNLQFFPDSPFTSRLKWSFPREFDSAWDLGYDRIPAKLLSDHFADYIGTTIVVPITAVSLLSRVLCWSAGKALILAGDRGVIHRDEVLAAKEPFVSFGADVRIPVNFDLLSLLARDGGGFVAHSQYRGDFVIALLSFGQGVSSLRRTRWAFRQWSDCGSPEAISLLESSLCSEAMLSLRLLLLLLRLAQSDSDSLWQFRSFLVKSEGVLAKQSVDLRDLKLQLEQVGESRGDRA